jgi:hypothetical protein
MMLFFAESATYLGILAEMWTSVEASFGQACSSASLFFGKLVLRQACSS